ncbi:hypothetical protein C1J03_20540 [Sulfitobacter sp. SK012]|uniref:hypothetical protein n=1 Tax=Sulfitobacter sp. SK012 TaxID=1389005 RepID=UPI000E0ACDD3|nr:hypothetical protein [Sulfitobacter sp. SK012]AXI48177.1 hypothetical protein C1J03_20540 [Sulfitobacter sp. SK012]
MAAEWTDEIELDPAQNSQDPAQHWLLVPSPVSSVDKDHNDLIVAYTFLFTSVGALEEFQSNFAPGGDYVVVFPTGLKPLELTSSGQVLAVGFSELGALSSIYSTIERREWGELLLTGVPIEDIEAVGSMDLAVEMAPGDSIVAIMDTGIGFANARFRKSVTETRIIGFWDQDALTTHAAIDIDQLLNEFNQGGNVDEHALYADDYANSFDPERYPRLPTSLGHGTHVLDVMTGGDGPGDPIIAVNLSSRAVDATHGNFLIPSVLMAVLWIFQLAGQSGKPQINFSFGGIAGGHDGHGPMEWLFDTILNGTSASAITIPAGNFFDTDTHASFRGDELATKQTLGWIVQPDDGTSNLVEIWLPTCNAADPQIELTVTPPGGPTLTITDAKIGKFWELLDGDTLLARVYVQCVGYFFETPRVRIMIAVRHTAIDRDYFQFQGGRPDLAGRWEIGLKALSLDNNAKAELWVERDDALGLARNGARQSYFDAQRPVWPEVAIPPIFVQNAGTISDIATGSETLVAAGSFRKSRQPALYSSEGFDHPFAFPPTAAAICDDSRVHGGVLASGYFSGSTFPMNGTSVSSAMSAHIVASRVHSGLPVTRTAINTLATTDDGRAIPMTAPINPLFETYDPVPPETRIGGGCLTSDWTRLPRFES